MNKIVLIIIIQLSFFSTFSAAREEEKFECGSATSWHDVNYVVLNMSDDQSNNKSKWIMKVYSGNDIFIEKDESYQNKITKGVLGVVSGKMMITKGLELESGYEIDAADGPALMIQLLLRLLSETVPSGPAAVNSLLKIDHKETEKGIKVATAAASGVFGAPWSVSGQLIPDKDAGIDYTLQFIFEVGGNNYKIFMDGRLVKDNSLGILSGDFNITDWQIYTIGPFTKKYEGGTILDYGAQPISEKFNSITSLREYIAEQTKHNKSQERTE